MALSSDFYKIIQRYRGQMDIDRNNLEDECCGQPALYEEVSRELTAANRRRDDAKAELDRIEGNLYIAIVKDPGKFGLPKATGDIIAAQIKQEKSYQDALKTYNGLKEEAGALSGLVEAFSQRKSMIRDLVDMFVHSYYTSQELAGPSSRSKSHGASPEDKQQFEKQIAEQRKARQDEKNQESQRGD